MKLLHDVFPTPLLLAAFKSHGSHVATATAIVAICGGATHEQPDTGEIT